MDSGTVCPRRVDIRAVWPDAASETSAPGVNKSVWTGYIHLYSLLYEQQGAKRLGSRRVFTQLYHGKLGNEQVRDFVAFSSLNNSRDMSPLLNFITSPLYYQHAPGFIMLHKQHRSSHFMQNEPFGSGGPHWPSDPPLCQEGLESHSEIKRQYGRQYLDLILRATGWGQG